MAADEVIVDLTNYKDKVGQHIKPGAYTVVVEDAEPDTSKQGNPMVNMWLRVQGGEFDGATVIDRLTQSKGALFRTVNFMQAIGLPTPKKRFKLPMKAIIGKTLDVLVDDGEPYKGKIKSEVREYGRKGTLIALAGGAAAAGEEAAIGDDDDLSAFAGDTDDDAETSSDEAGEEVTVPADDSPEEVDLEELDLG